MPARNTRNHGQYQLDENNQPLRKLIIHTILLLFVTLLSRIGTHDMSSQNYCAAITNSTWGELVQTGWMHDTLLVALAVPTIVENLHHQRASDQTRDAQKCKTAHTRPEATIMFNRHQKPPAAHNIRIKTQTEWFIWHRIISVSM